MRRHSLSLTLLSLCLALSSPLLALAEDFTTTSAQTTSAEGTELFSDVSPLNPHRAAIAALVEQGVLEGFEDGTFRPDQNVTRAEAAKIILLGLDVEVDETANAALSFDDVSTDDWYLSVVSSAVDLGVIEGYEDNTFRAAQNVNRAEALKMALFAAGIEVADVNVSPFEDVPTDAWFVDYAEYAKNMNIVPPQANGLWEGSAPLTRAKISELVYRLQVTQESGGSFNESTNWLRQSFPTVDISMKVPFGWNMKGDGVGALWLLDQDNGQISLLSPYANGGTVLMTRYSNLEEKTASQFFNPLHSGTEDFTYETEIDGYPALVIDRNDELLYREWYVYLPNNALIHLQGLRGDGFYSDYLEGYMNLAVESLIFEPGGNAELTLDEIKEALRAGIQVDGEGAELQALLEDWTLIETDAIGVGTGPVDYFYSASVNMTIKYERSFDVILDLREGESTAF